MHTGVCPTSWLKCWAQQWAHPCMWVVCFCTQAALSDGVRSRLMSAHSCSYPLLRLKTLVMSRPGAVCMHLPVRYVFCPAADAHPRWQVCGLLHTCGEHTAGVFVALATLPTNAYFPGLQSQGNSQIPGQLLRLGQPGQQACRPSRPPRPGKRGYRPSSVKNQPCFFLFTSPVDLVTWELGLGPPTRFKTASMYRMYCTPCVSTRWSRWNITQ